MKVEPRLPVGAVVRGVSLDREGSVDHDVLREALAEHGVLVLRDQQIDDDAFVRFLAGFGELQFTAGETPVPGRADLNVVTNVGRDRAPVSNWHVDTAYVSSPPAYTALRAVQVPARGGETLFSNQYRAWDDLDPRLGELVAGRTITHGVTGVDPGAGAQTEAAHPVVRPHPRTGRPALLLDAPARCRRVSGLDDDAAGRLVAELLAWSTRPDNVWRHRWQPGDVVIWDNAVVLHRADHADVVGDRTFHRGMVSASGYAAG
ncbi:MAG: TauD/TfdA family dioxygenase [Actinomycetota bacterium]